MKGESDHAAVEGYLAMYEFAVDIKRSDFEEFISHRLNEADRSRARRFWITMVEIAAFAVATVIYLMIFDFIHWPSAVFSALVVAWVVLATYQDLKRTSNALIPADEGVVLGKKTIGISEQGVVETAKHYTQSFDWLCILAVGTTDSTLFLQIDHSGAVLIPKRFIENEDALIRDIRAWTTAAC